MACAPPVSTIARFCVNDTAKLQQLGKIRFMANRIAFQRSTPVSDVHMLNGWWIATEAMLAGRRLPDDLLDDFLLRS